MPWNLKIFNHVKNSMHIELHFTFSSVVQSSRLALKTKSNLKKIVVQKINVILFFDIEFLNIFSEFYMTPVARD
jgi:hypothetical protein